MRIVTTPVMAFCRCPRRPQNLDASIIGTADRRNSAQQAKHRNFGLPKTPHPRSGGSRTTPVHTRTAPVLASERQSKRNEQIGTVWVLELDPHGRSKQLRETPRCCSAFDLGGGCTPNPQLLASSIRRLRGRLARPFRASCGSGPGSSGHLEPAAAPGQARAAISSQLRLRARLEVGNLGRCGVFEARQATNARSVRKSEGPCGNLISDILDSHMALRCL